MQHHLPLSQLRLYVYATFLLWAVLLLGISAARIAYTTHLPPGDPLHDGVSFYDPPVVALLVCAILGVLFAAFMISALYRRFTHPYLTTLLFELGALLLLWTLWLASSAAATKVWPDLSFCVQWRACTNLQAMLAFAWLGWLALSAALGLAAAGAGAGAHRRGGDGGGSALRHEHVHGAWAERNVLDVLAAFDLGRLRRWKSGGSGGSGSSGVGSGRAGESNGPEVRSASMRSVSYV